MTGAGRRPQALNFDFSRPLESVVHTTNPVLGLVTSVTDED
jgi:hypothetical protein